MRLAELACALALAIARAGRRRRGLRPRPGRPPRPRRHAALPRRGGGHRRGAGRRADAPRDPAPLLRHALRLRPAAAGGLLDEEHADPARHALLRRRRPADPDQEPGAAARRDPGRGRRRGPYVLEINGGLADELGIDLGAELRHPAVTGAAWSCTD